MAGHQCKKHENKTGNSDARFARQQARSTENAVPSPVVITRAYLKDRLLQMGIATETIGACHSREELIELALNARVSPPPAAGSDALCWVLLLLMMAARLLLLLA